MVGYSKRSLVDKLGMKPGFKVLFLNTPENYATTLGRLPANTKVVSALKGPLDFIQFFTTSEDQLNSMLPELTKAMDKKGMLWISWPKGRKTPGQLNENVVRKIGINHNLVDIKVASIDEVWSGLKFVIPLKDR